MIKFNYILNDLALSNLITKCLYIGSANFSDKEELENQIKLIQQENKQLKEEYNKVQKAYEETFSNYQNLKDNWNKLKEYIGYEWYSYDNDSVEFEVSKDILNKMRELEQGSSSDE